MEINGSLVYFLHSLHLYFWEPFSLLVNYYYKMAKMSRFLKLIHCQKGQVLLNAGSEERNNFTHGMNIKINTKIRCKS